MVISQTPALSSWLLPSRNTYGTWPMSGEIDIMEPVGWQPAGTLHATLHTAACNHRRKNQAHNSTSVPVAHDAFHVYAAERTRDRIDILVDGVRYHSFENARTTPDEWPFDQKFHLLLNVTVGGTWGGVKGVGDEVFPCSMDVKYVRVYQSLGMLEDDEHDEPKGDEHDDAPAADSDHKGEVKIDWP